jgi:hypothetical protein
VTLIQVIARIRERQRRAEEADPTASASIESIGVLMNAMLEELEADPEFKAVKPMRDLIQEVVEWGKHPERAEGNEGEDNAFPATWFERATELLTTLPKEG